MRFVHNTRSLEYRDPFGAVPVGGTVRLAADVLDGPVASVTLRLWSDTRGERLVEMAPAGDACVEGGVRYVATIEADEPELLWYHFRIAFADGGMAWYGACQGREGGEGAIYGGEPPSFQLTVYRPRATRPDWYTGGLVYQIFPDRFRRGEGWQERVHAALGSPRKGPGRALVEDWDTQPSYARNPDGSIARWDFWGGTLSGVREKLPYLRDLGVTAIYLNPIFEAASNHRYDTGDYLRVDPMLGDDEELGRLCDEAAGMGISVILDGVFNHTGSDSLYFNRYGNYPGLGAYQSEDSPYRPWYTFHEDGTYDCWWGVDDLPATNDAEPGFRGLICGEPDGVVRRWLRAGARGWRLDVADELSEGFLEDIHAAATQTRPDALVLGEVWEDASNKISYGKLRHYLLGDELDGAMNYPLRDALLPYVMGELGAPELAETLEGLHENYPHDAFYSSLNLLGSHDRMRLLTYLGGAPDPAQMSDEQRAAFRLDDSARGLAKARLWLATLVQMTMPGVPSIYYGDEAGMEGYADPYNRGPYPWGHEDPDTMAIYRNAIGLRRSLPHFVDGGFRAVSSGDDVFGLVRPAADEGERAVADTVAVLVNRSFEPREATVDLGPCPDAGAGGEQGAEATVVREVVSGEAVGFEGTVAHVALTPMGSAVVVRRPAHELDLPMGPGVGVLAHVTSLPDVGRAGRPGTLGAPAHAFVDMLERAGVRYWQVLPVNPCDQYGSPYAGLSAFAGNVGLVDGADALDELVAKADVEANAAQYRDFCEREGEWLRPYAAFRAIKDLLGSGPWQEWPERWRDFSPEVLADPELQEGMGRRMAAQFAFERAWQDTRAYANEHGVRIIGDMPMYVSADSADVWAHRELFELDEAGRPARVSGMPPDRFSKDGQVWGNPTYRWDVMGEQGYAWWVARFRRAMAMYDHVRLDHFLGFANFFSLPAGEGAAKGGWRFGPGRRLFEVAHDALGGLPFLAEDLGVITPAVRMLVETCGFPGMDVAQFCDYDVRGGYRPVPGKVAYASTHDTSTLVGWCAASFGEDGAPALARQIMDDMAGSGSDVLMVSLQDAMLLGDDSRMNVPGTTDRNWKWQADEALMPGAEELLRELVERQAGER
jgi:4-alpha-glucanotransferase/glycosidase